MKILLFVLSSILSNQKLSLQTQAFPTNHLHIIKPHSCSSAQRTHCFQHRAFSNRNDDPMGSVESNEANKFTTKVSTEQSNRRLFLSSTIASAGLFLSVDDYTANAIDSTTTTVSQRLPWTKDPLNPKRSSLKVVDAESLGYNLAFVTYLSRFLLNFDPLAQQFWIDGAKDIPIKANADQIFSIREEQFSKFAASVELGLLRDFQGPDGTKRLLENLSDRFGSMEETTTTSLDASDVKQQRLIRETKEARRQLALLFGLLQDFQPTSEITKLLAQVDNGSLSSVEFIDGDLPRGFALGETPILEVSPPQAGDEFIPATVEAQMETTGELLEIKIVESTGNFEKPPTLIVSPPTAPAGRAAQVRAKLKNGNLVGIEMIDPGAGYTQLDNIRVTIKDYNGSPVITTRLQPILETKITGVKTIDGGTGYAVEKPIRIGIKRDGRSETIAFGRSTGERGSFTVYRKSADNTVRAFERALDERDGNTVLSATTSGGSLPPLPFTSKASSSQQLLTLLPEGFGLEYERTKKRYFLTVDNEMVAAKYSGIQNRLLPDFGPRCESPIERSMDLSLSTFLRLSLSGAICASGVHLALTPLDVVKTKVQTNPAKYSTIVSSFGTIFQEEGVGTFFTGWAPTFSGYFAQGAVLYATTELIRRTLTESAGVNAASLEVPIILLSAGIASAFAATVLCPFDAVRIRSVAQPEFGPNALAVTKRMVEEEGFDSLFDSVPVFLARQVPYACVKFTIFDLSTEFLYKTYPAAQEDLKLSLLISLFGGIMGGVAAAAVSNPADAVISELKKAKSEQTPQEALQALLDRAGVSALFTGLPLRMVFYSLNASLQFLVYDGIRFALGIGPDDLRLFLDVLGGVFAEKGTIA